MTDLAVIKAAFSDWRTVKGRKSLQLVFEVPLEQQGDVLSRLGAPLPDNPKWCAIAVLAAEQAEPKQPDPSRSDRAKAQYRNLPPMKQAAARAAQLCADPLFGAWLSRKHKVPFPQHVDPVVIAANWMRRHLGAESRSEIGMDEGVYRKFLTLESTYRADTGQMAEQRG